MNNPIPLYFILFALCFYACEDLEVSNLNAPDLEQVQESDNYLRRAGGLIRTWFMINHDYSSPAIALTSSSDALTSSWGTAGMRDFGLEPRQAFNNRTDYFRSDISLQYYKNHYINLANANDIIRFIKKRNVQDCSKELAVAYFVQGVSLGYLGLIYDKAFLLTHETDLSIEQQPVSYSVMVDNAIIALEKCIELCHSEMFEIPEKWIPGHNYSNETFAHLASSMAARIIAYAPRNHTENLAVNWQKVYDLAKVGIEEDFAPLADDVDWYSLYHTYSVYPGWALVDMYVINLLDPNMPNHFPASGDFDELPNEGVAYSYDKRLEMDFENLSSCYFRPERGTYYFSNYRYARHDEYIEYWNTKMPDFRKAENDYLLAEACVYLKKIDEAANVLNKSARVLRGELPLLNANKDELLNAIHYERMIELLVTGLGVQYFQMRKYDRLQKGTLLHFPIPALELDIVGLPYYTFGGNVGESGKDYSAIGWR